MKGQNGELLRKEIVIEIFIAKDQASEYQLLKQINMNLAQFVDTGKIDDVITFQDVNTMFVFELEVVSALPAPPL